jgi:hypothetical protein
MNLKRQMTGRVVLAFTGLAAFAGSMLSSCDTLESDKAPAENITLNNDAIYVTPSSSGIINLRSLVNSNSNVRLQVSSQPQHGSLTSLGNDLLLYTKDELVTSAHDGFLLSIFSPDNTFLKSDSVIIIVSPDSTAVPCNGLIAITDYAYYSDTTNNGGYVDIAVLANDMFCGLDSNQVQVSIPQLENVNVPYYGSIQIISDGRIRYTPNSEFAGEDKFIYQITKPANVPNQGDPEVVAHGFVYISGAKSCKDQLELFNDEFLVTLDSVTSDTTASDTTTFGKIYYFNVVANDNFCTQAVNNFSFSMVEFPEGEWEYALNYGFKYIAPSYATSGFVDTFSYQVCVDDVCKQATVTITCQ